MVPSAIPPFVLEGWYVLHQCFQVEGRNLSPAIRRKQAAELDLLFLSWADMGESGWSGAYRILGSGGDFLAIHLRPSLEDLSHVQSGLRPWQDTGHLSLVDDFVSVVELGLYSTTLQALAEARSSGVNPGTPEWEALAARHLEGERSKGYVRARLHPGQPPELPYVSVYPMDRRRRDEDNWYRLPLEERAAMMSHHGSVGRRYAGRISQIISGAIGFDSREWMVTLFARDPLDFKHVVTEMRYGESTARYSDFGTFRAGWRLNEGEVSCHLANF